MEGEQAMSVKDDGTYVCAYWKRCCCSYADDLHCWECGSERDAHVAGECFPNKPKDELEKKS
jgi:hypothetical protein